MPDEYKLPDGKTKNTIYWTTELRDRTVEAARRDGRSLNSLVVNLIRKYVENDERKKS